MTSKPKIGFVGLGSMGLPMAKNLVAAGYPVKGYDINPAAVQALAAAGGTAAASVIEAVTDAAVLLLVVVNAQQVEDVLFGAGQAVPHLPPGSVVVVHSTVEPVYVRQLAPRLYAAGLELLDAPISGGIPGATQGTLAIMASGHPAAFAQVEPVLKVMGSNLFMMGAVCGLGATMKVVNQLLCGVHIAAAAEAIALGTQAGIDSQRILDVISTSAANSWMFQDRVPRMVSGDYTTTSAVDIFVKDLGIVLETGKTNRFPLPLAAAAHQLFLMATASGHGQEHDAAVVKVYEQLTGINVKSQQSGD
jgi:L-threonate 2-dehydrogenase